MQKIIPFLWFEKDMAAVISYYKEVFVDVISSAPAELHDTPSGDVQTRSIKIFGFQLDLITAGPYLPFSPTVSFIVNCESEAEVDQLWTRLTKEGKELMPIASYDFAKRYGWVQDKYGVSWQVIYLEGPKPTQKITPTLMFCGDVCGRAEEAMNLYVSLFKNSMVHYNSPYEGREHVDDVRAKTMHAGFELDGLGMCVFDSAKVSPLNFDQAISFVVYCKDQDEIDYFWTKLTENGGKEVECGWLNDRFGVPWQIVPIRMTEMMSKGTKEQVARVTQCFLKMKKFNIAELESAYAGAV